MTEKNLQANDVAARELKISRTLNAPVALVWKVFTEPQHIKNWWGPDGFTNTIFKMEVKEGGQWDFMMHGPDGRDYRNTSVFTKIVEHERIVFEHVSAPHFITTISFAPQGDKTVLHWHMLFDSAEQLEQVVKVHGAAEGLKQNIVKLEAYLETQKTMDSH